jgi:hypothetical protein
MRSDPCTAERLQGTARAIHHFLGEAYWGASSDQERQSLSRASRSIPVGSGIAQAWETSAADWRQYRSSSAFAPTVSMPMSRRCLFCQKSRDRGGTFTASPRDPRAVPTALTPHDSGRLSQLRFSHPRSLANEAEADTNSGMPPARDKPEVAGERSTGDPRGDVFNSSSATSSSSQRPDGQRVGGVRGRRRRSACD